MSLEELIKTPPSNPINEFSKFDGVFPIADPSASTRDNAQLTVWQNDSGFFVIPSKIGGVQYSLQDASQMAIEQGEEKYPKFNNLNEAMIWAYNKNNCVNEDGTVS